MPNNNGNPVQTYVGTGLVPRRLKGNEVKLVVSLPPGAVYPAGQVLGQVNGTGTAVNDVQTITVTGTPTGGNVIWSFNGSQFTLPYNSTASAAQALIVALANVGAGNVAVTGGPLPGTPLVFTFQGACAGLPEPLMVQVANALTGGTSPASTIAHTTTGKSATGYWKAYASGNSDGSQNAKLFLEWPCAVDTYGNITFGDTAGTADGGYVQTSTTAWANGIFDTADLTGLDAAAVTALNGRLLTGSTATLGSTTVLTLLEI